MSPLCSVEYERRVWASYTGLGFELNNCNQQYSEEQKLRSHNVDVVPVLFVKKNKAHIDTSHTYTSRDIKVTCNTSVSQ